MSKLRNSRLATATHQAKAHRIQMTVAKMLIGFILLSFLAGFVAVSLYNRTGAFTISATNTVLNDEFAISLCETEDFINPTATLNAPQMPSLSDMAEDQIPDNLDSLNGGIHNESDDARGLYYFSYTFYLKNTGSHTISYNYTINILEATRDLEKCVRIRLYENGDYTTYAYPKTQGEPGAEPGTVAFAGTGSPIVRAVDSFQPGDIHRYTIVMWIEGNDPETVDSVAGGIIRLSMRFTIANTGA